MFVFPNKYTKSHVKFQINMLVNTINMGIKYG